MAKKYHVYSKIATDMNYNDYAGGSDQTLSRVIHTVTIKGGAGVANKNIITPRGVHTEISEEDKNFLLRNGIFQKHFEAGFVTIEEHFEDPDKVATNLTEGPDPSAPLTPEDFHNVDDEKAAVPETIKQGRRKK